MYKIITIDKEHTFNEVDEVINYVNHYEGETQIITVKIDNKNTYIEVGIGRKDNKWMLFFVPETDLDDMLITHNNCKELRDLSNDISFKTKSSTFKCSRYHLINKEEALEGLKYFLKNHDYCQGLHWHAY